MDHPNPTQGISTGIIDFHIFQRGKKHQPDTAYGDASGPHIFSLAMDLRDTHSTGVASAFLVRWVFSYPCYSTTVLTFKTMQIIFLIRFICPNYSQLLSGAARANQSNQVVNQNDWHSAPVSRVSSLAACLSLPRLNVRKNLLTRLPTLSPLDGVSAVLSQIHARFLDSWM